MFRKQLWPTVTVKGNYNVKGMSKRSGDGLITALKNLGCETVTTEFACWYMGFPSDWLSNDFSEMPSSHSKRAKRSVVYSE